MYGAVAEAVLERTLPAARRARLQALLPEAKRLRFCPEDHHRPRIYISSTLPTDDDDERFLREVVGVVIGAPALYGVYAALTKSWPADALIRYQLRAWGHYYPWSTGVLCLVVGAVLSVLGLVVALPVIRRLR